MTHPTPSTPRDQAEADWPAEAAHLKKVGAPDFAPSYAQAWIVRRASELIEQPPHTREIETIASPFFPNLTSAAWDAADFTEISRTSLRHMLLAAYAAGAKAERDRTAPAIEKLTEAANAIRREINGGLPIPAATTERRIRAALTTLQRK